MRERRERGKVRGGRGKEEREIIDRWESNGMRGEKKGREVKRNEEMNV